MQNVVTLQRCLPWRRQLVSPSLTRLLGSREKWHKCWPPSSSSFTMLLPLNALAWLPPSQSWIAQNVGTYGNYGQGKNGRFPHALLHTLSSLSDWQESNYGRRCSNAISTIWYHVMIPDGKKTTGSPPPGSTLWGHYDTLSYPEEYAFSSAVIHSCLSFHIFVTETLYKEFTTTAFINV